jgi:hypothetical protein
MIRGLDVVEGVLRLAREIISAGDLKLAAKYMTNRAALVQSRGTAKQKEEFSSLRKAASAT